MSRRLWIALGLSVCTHLALSLALLRPRVPAPVAEAPIEIELLSPASPPTPIAAAPTPPTPEAAPAPAPRASTRKPPARRGGPRTPTPAPSDVATLESAPAPAATDAPAGAPADRLSSFRDRNAPLALLPKPPPPPANGPRPGTMDALFNAPPDVRHFKTGDGLVGVQDAGNGVKTRVSSDGRIAFENPSPIKFKGLGVGFDVTDAVMAAAGDDPYAAQKARIAEATREQRFCLTLKDAEGDKRNALFRLKDNLERIAADGTLSISDKHAAVFDLWQGCLDTTDDVLANAARATIVAFIRRAFPAGSASAYTRVELAMLNRRRNCSRTFDPYVTGSPARRPDAGADPH